ncbi:(2Fe-2S)-binding protein [candidate division KSB1 bacterium]|nr:(2Fe-2S)-binding protein [candidate division KSB1 bacterium]
MQETIKFNLNGKSINIEVDPERSLLWVLRTDLQLTGTKYACGEGFCGACTVLVNNQAERSCQLPVKNVAGKKVITIEGLTQNGVLHPLQKAFIEHEALQCGFCTPGMILSALSLLNENPQPTRTEVIDGMEDVFCRCGSHQRIVAAILAAAQEMKGGVK